MSRLGRELIKSLRGAVLEGGSTWQLYKDKPFLERLSMVIYTCDILDPLFKAYYSIDTFFANVRRLIEFAPLVWQHRNWDYGFVLRFNLKLHELLYKGVFTDGHHVYTKNDTRKLKTVINLYKRLNEDQYDEWQTDYLEKKYGRSEYYFPTVTGADGRTYTTLKNRREDSMTEKQKEDYIKDRKEHYKMEEYQRKQDFALLGKYIAKYSAKWWD